MAKTRREVETSPRREAPRPARARARTSAEGPLFERRNYILFGVALLVIVLGFVFLAGGSITLAPLLLVVGYAVLVPWAILHRPRPKSAQAEGKTARPGE